MDAVEVTAHFDLQGKITPTRFAWQGRSYPVQTGRRWQDEQGVHILVMGPGEQVYELLFAPAEGRWYLARTNPGGRTA